MAFTLMTTGANLILLWVFSRAKEGVQRFLQPLAVFGRTPLFFYVLRLFLYAGIGYLLAPNGTSVPVVYPLWLLGLLILFGLGFFAFHVWLYFAFLKPGPPREAVHNARNNSD